MLIHYFELEKKFKIINSNIIDAAFIIFIIGFNFDYHKFIHYYYYYYFLYLFQLINIMMNFIFDMHFHLANQQN